jgi:hypothetical protein
MNTMPNRDSNSQYLCARCGHDQSSHPACGCVAFAFHSTLLQAVKDAISFMTNYRIYKFNEDAITASTLADEAIKGIDEIEKSLKDTPEFHGGLYMSNKERADRLERMVDTLSDANLELRRQVFFASEETQKYRERVENLEKMITNKA